MRRRPDYTTHVESRICHLRQRVGAETQILRNKWINELDELFDIAILIAKGKVDQQQVDGKLQHITPKERQMWAQVTANLGQVMGNLSKGYDETQFNEDIDELERLIDEVKILSAEAVKQGPDETVLICKDKSLEN